MRLSNLSIKKLAYEHMLAESKREYYGLDSILAARIADAYEAANHQPHDSTVRRAYRSFIGETCSQFIRAKGLYTFEPWTGTGQPYANSREMRQDVHENQHLFFFLGGDWPSGHPMAALSPFDAAGLELTFNDIFRAIHDLYGHALNDYEFGARGEENAWRSHASMYSAQARAAMTTETRGQNCWVNFGAHLRRPDGSIPKEGEPGFVIPSERPYAPQKATLLPSFCLAPFEN